MAGNGVRPVIFFCFFSQQKTKKTEGGGGGEKRIFSPSASPSVREGRGDSANMDHFTPAFR